MFMDWKTKYCQDVILPKLISIFNTISIKIPASLFVVTDELILKCIWECKVPRIANRANKQITLPDFKTCNIRQCGSGTNTDILINRKTLSIRNKPLILWSTDFPQSYQDYSWEKEQSVHQLVLGKKVIHSKKTPQKQTQTRTSNHTQKSTQL